LKKHVTADSGASTQVCNRYRGVLNLEDANMTISVANGRKVSAFKIREYKRDITVSEGKIMTPKFFIVP
jgi:hypothetical protein